MLKKLVPLLSLLIAFCLVFSSLSSAEDAKDPMSKVLKLPFGKWYKPVEYKVTPAVKGYQLPLAPELLAQFSAELSKLKISPSDPMLTQNGFIISDRFTTPSVADFYEHYRDMKQPIYITTDSVLHLYHILFDKILAEAEEKNFAPYLNAMFAYNIVELDKLLAGAQTDGAKDAINLAKNYTLVAQALLNGSNGNSPLVSSEIKLISAHAGFAPSPLFSYKEDYSQYVPRGHYTHSETLKNYFKCMMYLGRMTFLAKGFEKPGDDAIVDIATAKKQTLAAVILADTLRKYPKIAQYNTIYDFTSFFVGYSDDLTPNEYNNAIANVIGTDGNIFSITSEETFRKLQFNILKLDPPAIYSGTGNIVTFDLDVLSGIPKPEVLQKALLSTMGMRLMGQRFVIDSYMTGQLVTPTIGSFLGTGNPFSGKPYRIMPTALDIMSILGSDSAGTLLTNGQLNKYKNYAETAAKIKGQLNALSDADWNKNLYMGWLHSLKALFAKSGEGHQPFQRTNAWENRQLLSALGSWTALRHDTILYVKQSYTMKLGSAAPPKPPKTMAFVEGEPEFWARLLTLHQTMQRGLATYGLNLHYEITDRLNWMDGLLKNVLDVSIAQLENKPLTPAQTSYLENIADFINGIQGKVFKETTTQIVADVHTDTNTKSVLEEGTGSMMTMIVAISNPDGSISLAYGPVYSYYEFKQPMNNRLTDEKWRVMLKNNAPAMPEWIKEMISKPAPIGVPLEKDRF